MQASGSYLLDTNIVIALFAQDNSVLSNLATAGSVFVSSIVLGELFFGAYKSTHVAQNVARLDAFASRNAVLVCSVTTSRYYGQVKNGLRAKGRPIPENDVWLAATALQYNLILVSCDTHFSAVDGLAMEVW